MKYALIKFRVHLLGQNLFVIYTDHASLRTETSSPHLPQRMARWLSFFAEYDFTVEYKPGKQNVLADALSRRPDYELAHLDYLESPLYELIHEVYADEDDLAGLVVVLLRAPNKAVELTARQRSRLHRYSVVEGLLYYQVDGGGEPQIVVPNDEDLRHHGRYEAHDTLLSGHLGRVKTYTSVARNFRYPNMYKWVRNAFVHGLHSVLRERAAAPTYTADDAAGFEFGWGRGYCRRPKGPQRPKNVRQNAHIELFRNVLAVYDEVVTMAQFIAADNCNTNRSIASQLGVPLVGCASHRFNLAVKKFLTKHEPLLQKINSLPSQLRHPNIAAELRNLTPVRAKKRNATRWSSTYAILSATLLCGRTFGS
ncbi:unnamed protein product [Phytophthora fragariaefolia]|uniref:Unnamed protein product n=1 Tax=Phytophthora fragariaefolia TaxID=1490495 RepID=A0A9W6U7B3_9STRA|nr:unnamed protein product [Phytophthora fragariaefolia]